MKRQPLDRRPLTPWRQAGEHVMPNPYGGPPVAAQVYQRRVHDGRLTVLVADEPVIGWHLSVSFKPDARPGLRYPSYDEIADARYRLCPDEIVMAMLLPPSTEYIAVHPTTFHLHQIERPGWMIPTTS